LYLLINYLIIYASSLNKVLCYKINKVNILPNLYSHFFKYTISIKNTHSADLEWNNKLLSTKLFLDSITEISTNFDNFLYLTPCHILTQNFRGNNFFLLYRKASPHHAVAIFHCLSDSNDNWASPARAPFGSIQHHDSCTTEEIYFFLDCIIAFIVQKDGKKLSIQHYPECYLANNIDLAKQCFISGGFRESQQLLNHHIPVSDLPFAEIIRKQEKRRLQKCKKSGMTSQIEANMEPEEIYNFLLNCRNQKGYKLSLDERQLTELLLTFPEQVIVFSVRIDNCIVALSVSIRVNQRILYNFLTDSLPQYNLYSPSVLTTECIFNYCKTEQIQILDLGTSLDHHGCEKAGLVRFKDNIGALRSCKVTYTKDFFPI
jgi:hypothetical protein